MKLNFLRFVVVVDFSLIVNTELAMADGCNVASKKPVGNREKPNIEIPDVPTTEATPVDQPY